MKEEINLNPWPLPKEKIYLNSRPIPREEIYLSPVSISEKEIELEPQVAQPIPRLSKEVLLGIRRTLKDQATLGEPTPKIIKVIKRKNYLGR